MTDLLDLNGRTRPSASARALAQRRRELRAHVDAQISDNKLARQEGSDKAARVESLAARAAKLATRALAAAERLAPGAGIVARSADLAYGDGPRRRLDIYSRPHLREAPLIVFFYGGAWRSGAKEDARFVGLALARRGFVVAIPDHRLAPEAHFPDFIEDSAAAVRWARDHAVRFGADPDTILLMGHSAGAHNAMMLGLDPTYLTAAGVDMRAIRGLIGLAGPYDFYPFPLQLCVDAFGAAPDPMKTQPIAFAHACAPPVFLAAGTDDRHVPPQNTLSLADALLTAGAPCVSKLYQGLGHIDVLAALSHLGSGRGPVMEDVLAFAQSNGAAPIQPDADIAPRTSLGKFEAASTVAS